MKHASPRGANEWESSTKEQRKQQQNKTKIDTLLSFRTQVPDAPYYTKRPQKKESSTKEKQNKSGITPLGLLRKALNDSYTKNGDEPMSHENIYMSHSTLKNAIKGMEELHKGNEKSGDALKKET